MQLHIARSLEFFKDNFVHPAAGINQRRGDDSQTAAVFNIAGGAEKTFGFVQSVGIHNAGQNFDDGWHNCIVGRGEAG